MIDFHIHLLPGIDDGSRDWSETLLLARQSCDDDVTHVVVTPHCMRENLPLKLQERDAKMDELRNRLSDAGLSLELIPGLEYYADGHSSSVAIEHPGSRCGLPSHGEHNPMLIELPFGVDLSFASNVLFNTQLAGVPVVLAHPERYVGFVKRIDLLKELLDKGMYLQFNSRSFKSGLFNWAIPKAILKLIDYCGSQILVGSDAHDSQFRPAGLHCAREKITSAFGVRAWEVISQSTPRRLLGLQ